MDLKKKKRGGGGWGVGRIWRSVLAVGWSYREDVTVIHSGTEESFDTVNLMKEEVNRRRYGGSYGNPNSFLRRVGPSFLS